jgi:hypothetical protein
LTASGGGTLYLYTGGFGTYASISSGATGTGTVTVIGSLSQLNASLATLTYTAPKTGTSDSLSVQAYDGILNSTPLVVAITLLADKAPTLNGPTSASVTQNVVLPFSAANLITVADVDGSTSTETVALTASGGGTLYLYTGGFGTYASISSGATGTGTVTVIGSLSQLNASLATLTYTAPKTGTSDSLSVQAYDGILNSTPLVVPITLLADKAPTLNGPTSASVTQNVVLPFSAANLITVADVDGLTSTESVTLTVSGGGTLNISYGGFLNNATLTAGASGTGTVTLSGSLSDLNSSLATLTYKAPKTGTSDSLSVQAYDGILSSAQLTVPITLLADKAPTLNGPSSASVVLNVVLPFSAANLITVADSDGLTSTETVALSVSGGGILNISYGGFLNNATLAAGASGTGTVTLSGSLSDLNSSLATLTYTAPKSGTSDSLMIQANDGLLSSPQLTIPITLLAGNFPAITSANNATFTVGTAGSFTVILAGSPTPLLSITGTLPAGVSFNPNLHVLSGTPAAGTGNTYTLMFIAQTSGQPTATQTFTLTVNQAAVFTSTSSGTLIGTTLGSLSILASGYPTPTLTESGTDVLPSGLSFNGSSSQTANTVQGLLSGVADSSTGGTYTLHFTAQSGTTSAQQTYTLTIDQPPVFTNVSSATFAAGAAGSILVAATGYPNPVLSESTSDVLPSGVTFNASTGFLSGTPTLGSGGNYTLHFTAHNVTGLDATQIFVLSVPLNPFFTSSSSTTFAVGATDQFTVAAVAAPNPTLSESPTDYLPSGLSFDPTTGLLSGTPNAGAVGTYTLHFSAQNGVGPTATQTFTLTLAKIFSQSGSTLTINNALGLPFSIDFSDATHFVGALGGDSESFGTAQLSNIVITGDGTETASVTDTFNPITTTLTPNGMRVVGVGYVFVATGCPNMIVTGTGADTANLSDMAGNNRFYGYPTSSMLVNTDTGSSYSETAIGFGNVIVNSNYSPSR